MEKTYTEQEIKDWFASMMEKYKNCLMTEHLQMVYWEMFGAVWGEENTLQTFVEKRA